MKKKIRSLRCRGAQHAFLYWPLFQIWVAIARDLCEYLKKRDFSHLHCLYLLVAAVPGDQPAVFPSRDKGAVPQRGQSEDAALVGSLDDVADAISACETEMGRDGPKSSLGRT